MANGNALSVTSRRNRMIAIAAGAITVTAIVVAFAAEYLDLPWKWLRPGVELLLLAELVGLVVLERHQLFEPVHENVGAIKISVGTMQTSIEDLRGMITENMRSSGQVSACASTTEVIRTMTRVAREALARDQPAPQIFRLARLAGFARQTDRSSTAQGDSLQEDSDLAAEYREWTTITREYLVTRGSPPDARSRRWSFRAMTSFATLEQFDFAMEQIYRPMAAGRPINVENKILLRPRIEAMLSPTLITDRDVVMTFDDAVGGLRWGVRFQSPQYLALFARWFDDLWASIPDTYLLYSRNGFNQDVIDRIRKELGATEALSERRTTAS